MHVIWTPRYSHAWRQISLMSLNKLVANVMAEDMIHLQIGAALSAFSPSLSEYRPEISNFSIKSQKINILGWQTYSVLEWLNFVIKEQKWS